MGQDQSIAFALDNPWEVVGLIALGVVLRLIVPRIRLMSATARGTIVEFVDSGLIALLLVFCIVRPFIIQAFFIPSTSMLPTLKVHDRILVNKFIYRFRDPRPGEVIVFKAPRWADSSARDFIKRCMAGPGDTIEVRGGVVYLNNQPLKEPYKLEPSYSDWGPRIVPPGHYVVFGDNRNNSNDSRKWEDWGADGNEYQRPFLPRERILGKAMVVFFARGAPWSKDDPWPRLLRADLQHTDGTPVSADDKHQGPTLTLGEQARAAP
ncbi:MAG: signal peptidase I [Armatimonadota bacterium]